MTGNYTYYLCEKCRETSGEFIRTNEKIIELTFEEIAQLHRVDQENLRRIWCNKCKGSKWILSK